MNNEDIYITVAFALPPLSADGPGLWPKAVEVRLTLMP